MVGRIINPNDFYYHHPRFGYPVFRPKVKLNALFDESNSTEILSDLIERGFLSKESEGNYRVYDFQRPTYFIGPTIGRTKLYFTTQNFAQQIVNCLGLRLNVKRDSNVSFKSVLAPADWMTYVQKSLSMDFQQTIEELIKRKFLRRSQNGSFRVQKMGNYAHRQFFDFPYVDEKLYFSSNEDAQRYKVGLNHPEKLEVVLFEN